jgi:hypothetical protein
MQKIDCGGGVVKLMQQPTQTREIIDPAEVIETVKLTFTIVEAVKILIATIRSIFKKA